MSANPQHPRLGYCCKYKPADGDVAMARAMNTTTTTVTYLARIGPAAGIDKLAAIVAHNVSALLRQVAFVAGLSPLQRLLRLPSDLLPAYTHPAVMPLYADPDLRRLVERGLASLGKAARKGDVRVSMHPDQFCVISSLNEKARENGIRDMEYHADAMAMMGYHGGWHPHGAHVNVHGGARAAGVDGFRNGLLRLSAQARNLITVENDEVSYGTDDLLALADVVPVVLDLHHHWIASGGEYLEPADPRIARIRDSWRGTRPVAHVSVSREEFLPDHDPSSLPDFAALIAAGRKPRDLRAHSDMIWNGAVADLVGRHLAWADFEVEAKDKNVASAALAAHLGAIPALRLAA